MAKSEEQDKWSSMSKGKASKATITITPKSKAKPMAKAIQRTSTTLEQVSPLQSDMGC